ncbi:hypothetical protein EDD35_3971 [Amycolatopsis thermoflava]|uniref:Secreted protein n=2 Tax=Amycolatopsis thermoflava TaxID=84480 RepID=A0A3N2GY53_9PSEU|nr:hypothetical protein EDD35_3971 [Amycolatopsis thermoflava]
MRMITRTVAAGAIALPLTLGAAGIASADTVEEHEGVAYQQVSATAGPDGASYSATAAAAEEGTHADHDGTYADQDDDGGLLDILGL